jgi:hypothetical protein
MFKVFCGRWAGKKNQSREGIQMHFINTPVFLHLPEPPTHFIPTRHPTPLTRATFYWSKFHASLQARQAVV